MNQLEFSYEDYLHNLTKSCEKMENFNSSVLVSNLDDNCLDQNLILNKFMIEDHEEEEEDTSIDNLNLSSSLSNTISSTISSSSNSILPNDYSISSLTNNDKLIKKFTSDQKFDLTKQLQKVKSTSSSSKTSTSNLIDSNSSKASKVPIKKQRKVGVNHKFVNNPKHLKKSKQQQQHQDSSFANSFHLKFLKDDQCSLVSSFTNKSEQKLIKSNESFKNYSPQNTSNLSKG